MVFIWPASLQPAHGSDHASTRFAVMISPGFSALTRGKPALAKTRPLSPGEIGDRHQIITSSAATSQNNQSWRLIFGVVARNPANLAAIYELEPGSPVFPATMPNNKSFRKKRGRSSPGNHP